MTEWDVGSWLQWPGLSEAPICSHHECTLSLVSIYPDLTLDVATTNVCIPLVLDYKYNPVLAPTPSPPMLYTSVAAATEVMSGLV